MRTPSSSPDLHVAVVAAVAVVEVAVVDGLMVVWWVGDVISGLFSPMNSLSSKSPLFRTYSSYALLSALLWWWWWCDDFAMVVVVLWWLLCYGGCNVVIEDSKIMVTQHNLHYEHRNPTVINTSLKNLKRQNTHHATPHHTTPHHTTPHHTTPHHTTPHHTTPHHTTPHHTTPHNHSLQLVAVKVLNVQHLHQVVCIANQQLRRGRVF